MYRDEKTGVHQPKQGKLAVTLRIGKVIHLFQTFCVVEFPSN
jgi:hypothetical protein